MSRSYDRRGRLPPVHSPLSLRALFAGAAGSISSRDPVANLKQALIASFGSNDLLLLDSGTSALRVALTALRPDLADGSIALPAFCCYDVATAAIGARVPVTLYDIDPSTLAPDLDSLRQALLSGARVVVVAHLFGLPVDMEAVCVMAREHGAFVIEDAAQAPGTWIGDRRAGSIGSLAVLSFGRGKGLTGGGGGALLANDEEGIRRLRDGMDRWGDAERGARNLLLATAQWIAGRPGIYAIPAAIPWLRLGESLYREPHPVRPIASSSAGILTETLGLADADAEVRRAHAHRLLSAVPPSGVHGYHSHESDTAGWLRFPVRVGDRASRLTRPDLRLGIERSYPTPLDRLPELAASLTSEVDSLTGAEELARSLVTLPTHRWLRPDDLRALEDWLSRAAN